MTGGYPSGRPYTAVLGYNNLMRRSFLFIVVLMVFLALSPSFAFAEDALLELHFIDVAGGDSTFIKLPDNENILVDAGDFAAGQERVKYLRSIGAGRIDHLIFTHPHDDHIGGAFNIFSEFEIGNVYDNGSNDPRNPVFGDYIDLVRKDLSRYRVLRAGELLSFGEVKIEVINPMLPLTGRLNEDSIVLRVRYGDVRILLTGDMGKVGERRLMNTETELKSDVLKAGHHGSDDASSKEFLAAVGPRAAVITASKGNIYGRPGKAALNRFAKAGIKLYRTDLDGHVILKTDGKVFSLHTGKN